MIGTVRPKQRLSIPMRRAKSGKVLLFHKPTLVVDLICFFYQSWFLRR
jgi:hypothetical protein